MAAPVQLEVPHDVTAPVVVGCSGGADSLALLALAVDDELAPIAVHVDHGLRPGSEREAGVVADIATRLGAGFDARPVTVAGGANFEARARTAVRRARGRAARRTARRRCSWRTPPTTRPRQSCSTSCGGAVRPGWRACRPGGGVWCDRSSPRGRADVRAECARRGLVPWEDPSNDDVSFRRNWIRHEVLPLLERGRGPRPDAAAHPPGRRAAGRVRLPRCARRVPPGPVRARPAGATLAALPDPLARRAVRCWLGPPPTRARRGRGRPRRRARRAAGGRSRRRPAGPAQRRRVARRGARLATAPMRTRLA